MREQRNLLPDDQQSCQQQLNHPHVHLIIVHIQSLLAGITSIKAIHKTTVSAHQDDVPQPLDAKLEVQAAQTGTAIHRMTSGLGMIEETSGDAHCMQA